MAEHLSRSLSALLGRHRTRPHDHRNRHPRARRGGGVRLRLLEGYPAGVPPKDYIPLIALLRRRLSEDEIREIAEEIATLGVDHMTQAEIGVSITRLTDALPSLEDIARVEQHLNRYHDWPLEAS